MENQITIYIAGDSTAAMKLPEKRPETGWGEAFQAYFKENVRIENHAINGRSTKSFINEGHLAAIEKSIQPGDFLIIQFGHNDQKIEDPERGTLPYGDYQENLGQFIQVAFRKNAYPLLLTSVTRRKFEEDKIDYMSVGEYPQAMIQFAEKNHVPVIDIHRITTEFIGKIGNEESKKYYLHLPPGQSENYPEGIIDNTHFNEEGAKKVAQLIIEAIQQSDLPLRNLLK
ncbi:rhamnogalacturonan acetylesterase [Neobacillus sp. DY30]|uniref:rhamnogalacturonan acetylesterase n=1 Tax=Neobacillus sp. DY30 TaxID=3047871 RepID=UPI0024BF56AD|nr:rhamnogalacturonan acetylesterase [Neobacillus sp. DY30]WHY02784.1 rhamnogalacturonan acetylesterase [Neobacillus sp. DY30]